MTEKNIRYVQIRMGQDMYEELSNAAWARRSSLTALVKNLIYLYLYSIKSKEEETQNDKTAEI